MAGDLSALSPMHNDRDASALGLRQRAGRADTAEEKREALREASREFEAIFIYQMISAMRKTVGDGGLIKKSGAEKMFEGMLDEEWSKKLASKAGPNSLSEMLYRQLSNRLGLDEGSGASGQVQQLKEKGFMEMVPSPAALPLIREYRREGDAHE